MGKTTDSAGTFRWFKEDQCDRCGQCFISCPVLQLPEKVARNEIEKLIAGDLDESLVLTRCNTCNICDTVCPNNAYPYELILERFYQMQKQGGLPYIAKMIFPNEPENFWSGLAPLLDPVESKMVEQWRQGLSSPKDEILLTGFYTNLVPFLLKAKVFDELRPNIVGSELLWGCGGDSNKLGAIDITEQTIPLIREKFDAMKVQRVVCFMEAEAAMLTEILPERYGADFNFEAISLDRWILEKIESGKIELTPGLNMTVTVHDNCMSRYHDRKPQDNIREIVQKTGCRLVEMEHNRENALCCGWASTIPTLHGKNSNNPWRTLMNLLAALDRRLNEAVETGAQAMIAGCPACFIFLSMINEISGTPIKVLHPIQLVEMAAGRKPPEGAKDRVWELLAVTTNLLFNWGRYKKNRERFFPKPIDTGTESLPQMPQRYLKRTKALARIYKGRFVQNAVTKSFFATVVRFAVKTYENRLEKSKQSIID